MPQFFIASCIPELQFDLGGCSCGRLAGLRVNGHFDLGECATDGALELLVAHFSVVLNAGENGRFTDEGVPAQDYFMTLHFFTSNYINYKL